MRHLPAHIQLENWYVGENTRLSYLHVDEIVATRPIKRADTASVFLEKPSNVLDVKYVYRGEHKSVATMLEQTFTDGLLVLHQGKKVAEHYFAHMQAHHLHLSMSVAKSFTSTVLGILYDRGEIDLNKPVEYYVPELKHCGYVGATVDQVLDMRSGIKFDENYEETDSDALVHQFDRCMGWVPHRSESEPKSIHAFLLRMEKDRPHGGYFQYRSPETEVLGWIIANVTQMNLADVFSELLWKPMGAEMDAKFAVDSEQTCVADGGLNACLRDYGRFGQLIAQQGFFNDKQIVSEEWVKSCRSGDVEAYQVLHGFDPNYPLSAYKRQWWIHSENVHAAYGVGGQLIYIDHKKDVVIVKLSSWPMWRNDDFIADAVLAFEAITKELVD